tara:strand:- start:27564 stop:28580 length:1017 start_codon:yes stop_codon:yes gene_type:complete
MLNDKDIISQSVTNSIDGNAAVQAFFVLSGFLITHLLISEQKKYGTISLYNFYLRRSLRIFPLYFFVILLVAFFQYTGENVTNIKSIIFSAFYSYNFIPKAWYSPILGHTWSLAVEEHFYLIWPFVFITIAPHFKKLIRVLFIFISISLLLAIILTNINFINDNFFIKRWSFIAGSNIAMGGLLAILLADPIRINIKKLLRTKGALAIGLTLIFCETWFHEASYFITQYIRGAGFTILIGWITLNQKNILTKSLDIYPLRYLGKISYGIYMYQGLFISTGPYRETNQTWPPDQWIGIILLIIIAPLSYHYFEKPILNLKHKLQHSSNKTHNAVISTSD